MSTIIYALFEKPKNNIGKYEIPIGVFTSYEKAEKVALLMAIKNQESYTIASYQADALYDEEQGKLPNVVAITGTYYPKSENSNGHVEVSSIKNDMVMNSISKDDDSGSINFEIGVCPEIHSYEEMLKIVEDYVLELEKSNSTDSQTE